MAHYWLLKECVKTETLDLLKYKVHNTFEIIGFGKDFPYRSTFAEQIAEIVVKWDYMKSKIVELGIIMNECDPNTQKAEQRGLL